MAIVTADNGLQFVIAPYRELLTIRKRALLLQEIDSLAEQNGNYVRFHQSQKDCLEVIFSKENGYLLAECLWEHLGKPNHLIYCEALTDKKSVLLVVIRDGNVFLDCRLLKSELRDELLSLMTDKRAYRVITSGDVPLKKIILTNGFGLTENLIELFEEKTESLLLKIKANKQHYLKPLDVEIKQQKLKQNPLQKYLIILFILGLGFFGWHILQSSHAKLKSATMSMPSASPDFAYKQAMKTPSPMKQLFAMADMIEHFYSMPSINNVEYDFRGSHYVINVKTSGQSLAEIEQWAEDNRLAYQIKPQSIEFIKTSNLPVRILPKRIWSSNEIISYLIEQIDSILTSSSVNFGSLRQEGSFQSTPVVIQIDKISPQQLKYIGIELKNLPIQIQRVQLQQNSGLLTGEIQLSVWGS